MSNLILIPGLNTPIRNIFCIGRNYAEHAKELGNQVPTPHAEMVVFLKPISSVIFNGESIVIPAQCQRVDHEVEVVLAISRRCKNISESEAERCVAGVGIGLDITSRDLQEKAKKASLPWTVAKGMDTFAPLGNFLPFHEIQNKSKNWMDLSFSLKVNNQERQRGKTDSMIFPLPVLISRLSQLFTLEEGDLIFTGTPSGVGPLRPGDSLHAELGDGWSVLDVTVVAESAGK